MDIYMAYEASKESMSMYRKPKIKDSLAKNMFLVSNIDFFMADVTSEKVNEYKW